jgi:hypothetical protein
MVALSPSDRLGAAMIVRKRETNRPGADLSRPLVNAMVAKILPFLRNPERNSEGIGNLRPQAAREAHHEHAMSRIARDQGAARPGF